MNRPSAVPPIRARNDQKKKSIRLLKWEKVLLSTRYNKQWSVTENEEADVTKTPFPDKKQKMVWPGLHNFTARMYNRLQQGCRRVPPISYNHRRTRSVEKNRRWKSISIREMAAGLGSAAGARMKRSTTRVCPRFPLPRRDPHAGNRCPGARPTIWFANRR